MPETIIRKAQRMKGAVGSDVKEYTTTGRHDHGAEVYNGVEEGRVETFLVFRSHPRADWLNNYRGLQIKTSDFVYFSMWALVVWACGIGGRMSLRVRLCPTREIALCKIH